MKNILPEEYLNKNFDYTKLTKVALRKILFENDVSNIPSNIKKDDLEIYRVNIHDKIDTIKKRIEKDKLKMENMYQKDRSSILDLQEVNTPRKSSLAGKAVDTKFDVVDEKRQKVIKDKIEEIKNLSKKDLSLENSFSKSFISSRDSSLMEERLSVIKNGPKLNTYKKHEDMDKSLVEEENKIDIKQRSPDRKRISVSPKKVEKTSTPSKLEQFLSNRSKDNHDEDREKEKNFLDCSIYENTIRPNTVRNNEVINGKIKKTSIRRILSFVSWIICFIGVLVVLFLIFCFFKSLPYCKNGDSFCIAVPKNSTLIGDKIICNEGYVLRKVFFFNFCVRDDSEEKKRSKLIKSIVDTAELRNGEYRYGMIKSNKIPLKDLTEDPIVIELLRKIPTLVFSQQHLYSTKYKVSLRIVVRYYSKTAVIILLPFLLLLILIKYKIKVNRMKRERNEASKKIAKEILDVLLRQLLISTKNNNFPSHVYVDQLKDVFGDDLNIWKIVDQMVCKNSNVRSDMIGDKRIWEWIGPIICKQESIDHLIY